MTIFDQLEEQVAGPGADTEVADLIDDQQLRATEKADELAQPAFALGAGETVDDVRERSEVDAATGPHRLDAEGTGKMALAGAGLADEVNDLMAIDEVE